MRAHHQNKHTFSRKAVLCDNAPAAFGPFAINSGIKRTFCFNQITNPNTWDELFLSEKGNRFPPDGSNPYAGG